MGTSVQRIEAMTSSGELPSTLVGNRRLIPAAAVEAVLKAVPNPGSVSDAEVGRDFHGATVEDAVAAASEALGVRKEEVAFEVVDRGSEGFLGAGRRLARIKLRASERSRTDQGSTPPESEEANRDLAFEELASVKEIVDLPPEEALDRAREFLMNQGYRPVHRTDTCLTVERFQPGHVSEGEILSLSVTVSPQPEGGVKISVEGNDSEGLRKRQAQWIEWAESLPKNESAGQADGSALSDSSPSKGPTAAKANSPSASQVPPANKGGEYYTDIEVAHKLGKSYQETLRLANLGQLPVTFVDDRRVFHRQIIDDMAASKTAPQAEADKGDYYYTPGQAAQLLGKDAYEINQMIHQNKLPAVRVNDYRWISAQAVESMLSRKSWRRLKKTVKPHRIHVPEKTGSEEEEKPPTDLTRQQDSGEHRSSGSASAPQASAANREKTEENDGKRSTPETSEPRKVVHNFLKPSVEYTEDAASPSQETGAAVRRVRELEDEVQALKATLRADKEHWEHELEREREGRKQDNLDAQYEIDQIDAQIENQRRDVEALRAVLEEERSEKAEIERRAEELQTELDEERELRLATEDSLGPTGLDWHERDEYEERLAALSYALEEERKKRSGREEWTSGLQSRLEESEAEKQTLEEALSSEKEKTRRLEADKRLLNEVKRLLGAAGSEEPLEPDKETTSENVTEDETSGELLLKTPFGQVSFLPPFPLNEQEVELLRLIAREGELTAEQIRNQTGRRRAHTDLEHLLERLADEGVKPIREDIEDRYSFDPTALQND